MGQGTAGKKAGRRSNAARELIETSLFRAKNPRPPVFFRQLIRAREALPPLLNEKESAEWAAFENVPPGQLSPVQRARAEELGARRRKLTLDQSHALFLEGKAVRQIGVEVIDSGRTMFVDWYHSDDQRFYCACDTALDNGAGKIATMKEWRARLAEAQREGVRIPLAKTNPVRKAPARRGRSHARRAA